MATMDTMRAAIGLHFPPHAAAHGAAAGGLVGHARRRAGAGGGVGGESYRAARAARVRLPSRGLAPALPAEHPRGGRPDGPRTPRDRPAGAGTRVGGGRRRCGAACRHARPAAHDAALAAGAGGGHGRRHAGAHLSPGGRSAGAARAVRCRRCGAARDGRLDDAGAAGGRLRVGAAGPRGGARAAPGRRRRLRRARHRRAPGAGGARHVAAGAQRLQLRLGLPSPGRRAQREPPPVRRPVASPDALALAPRLPPRDGARRAPVVHPRTLGAGVAAAGRRAGGGELPQAGAPPPLAALEVAVAGDFFVGLAAAVVLPFGLLKMGTAPRSASSGWRRASRRSPSLPRSRCWPRRRSSRGRRACVAGVVRCAGGTTTRRPTSPRG